MNPVRKLLKSTENSLTSLHIQWWNFLNWYRQYEVEPYSSRYWWTRQQLVAEICDRTQADPEQWHTYIRQSRFRFYDERIVEYSWAASRIFQLGSKNRFLDVGCVMNTGYFLEKLLKQFSDIHFLNLVSEPLALQGRISFHSQDIRQCNLPKHFFDCITCISTLEHVGGDNSYNNFSLNGSAEIEVAKSDSGACWQEAFTSLMELLKPEGLLLVSMPYGGGIWKNGEYRLGEQDIQEFYQIASRYNRKILITIMQKDENGWTQIHESQSVVAAKLPPAGANAVALVETVNDFS